MTSSGERTTPAEAPAAEARALRAVLFVAASSTVAMALWLSWVVLAVLPRRDPAHVTFWSIAAGAFAAYAALTFAHLARGTNGTWLRGTVRLASVAAVIAGAWGVGTMLRTARTGGHFEGYILLMGTLLACHGAAALAHDMMELRVARRARRA